MEFPLYYLFIPFGFVILLTTLFVMFNFFHIAHFGLQGAKTAIVLASYIFFYVCMLVLVVQILAPLDWSQTIEINSIFSGTLPSI